MRRIILVLLEFVSTASAFAKNSLAAYKPIFGYITKIITKAHEYGFDKYNEPQKL